jgi:hypothetical protein
MTDSLEAPWGFITDL